METSGGQDERRCLNVHGCHLLSNLLDRLRPSALRTEECGEDVAVGGEQ